MNSQPKSRNAAPSLHSEVEDRFGVLPNFFRLAPDTPEITENLWGFAKFGYLDNPLPSLFKERLFVYLSQFCDVRYCISRHVGFLAGLGHPSGDIQCPPETIEQIVRLIQRPLPNGQALESHITLCLEIKNPLVELPEPESPAEEAIIACASHVFLQTKDATRCLEALNYALDNATNQHLLVFITFVKTAHFWTKVHPELQNEKDITELLNVHEALATCVLKEPESNNSVTTQVLLQELDDLRKEREEAELLRVTLTSIGDAVITTDVHGHVTMLNNVAESLTGWSNQEAAGIPLETVFNIVNETTRKTVENPAMRALREGCIVGLANHTILIAKDGAEHPIDDSAAPIKDVNGEITGAVLVFRDITERRQSEQALEESEERYRSLLQAITSIVWTTDAEGRFVSPQPSWSEYTGQTWQELQDFGWTNAVHPHDRESLNQAWEITRESKTLYEFEGRLWHAGTQLYRHVVARGVPILNQDGSVREWVGKCVDIEDRWQAEEQLRNQLDLTRSITDNATTAIFMMDNQSRCTFMNPAAEEMTGFSFEESEGQILHDLIHHTRPDGSPYPMPECPIDRALPEKFVVYGHEDLFFRKNGEPFPVSCNARPIQEGDEQIGTVIEVRDLTEERLAETKLQESETRFKQLADAIPQLAWIAQPDGKIEWYNRRWYEYTGTTFEEMKGEGWHSVHDPENLSQVIEQWQNALASGDPLDTVFPLRGADGQFRPFLTRCIPLHNDDGEILCWFGTNTDISEQKLIQEDLRIIAAKLSEADRRKDEFLATLAHELRNPLAPIRTGLEAMKLAEDDPEMRGEIRLTMERQTEQMVHLIDDLLDVSRITQGKMQLRLSHVELTDVMQSAIEATRPFIDEAGHELTVIFPEKPVFLRADPTRLAQVLSNLLNNSAKYTVEKGEISLTAITDFDEVQIVVKDSGIGIPDDKQEQIFEMFGQIEHTGDGGYAGLGIGLTLVRTLVQMHGGSIDVYSEGANRGSEFTIRLPKLADEAIVDAERNVTKKDFKKKVIQRILVVDDNTPAATMLKIVVQNLGHEVRTASNGQEALEVAAEFLPDVVLMDLGMPVMNGYEAAKHIREQSWGKQMILVALTGWGQDEDKRKTKAAGFDHHLVKPAEPAALKELLENHY